MKRVWNWQESWQKNDRIAEQVRKCEEKLELGESYYEALKETGMFPVSISR